MAFATLGKQIDIHTGGEDLQYTHHNAEIAQAEALTKKPYVSHWVHNAHVLIGTEKIAKSGTSLRLADITAEGYHPLALRYLYLMSSYRHPLSFSFESLSAANEALTRLWRFFYERPEQMIAGSIITPVYDAVSSALADDLDTPQALAHIATFSKTPPIMMTTNVRHSSTSMTSSASDLTSQSQKAPPYLAPSIQTPYHQQCVTLPPNARQREQKTTTPPPTATVTKYARTVSSSAIRLMDNASPVPHPKTRIVLKCSAYVQQ